MTTAIYHVSLKFTNQTLLALTTILASACADLLAGFQRVVGHPLTEWRSMSKSYMALKPLGKSNSVLVKLLVRDDHSTTIYAGNYRLRFFLDDTNWLSLIVPCLSHLLFCTLALEHWLTEQPRPVDKVCATRHCTSSTFSMMKRHWAPNTSHEQEKPICGRPRKPRPLILHRAHRIFGR